MTTIVIAGGTGLERAGLAAVLDGRHGTSVLATAMDDREAAAHCEQHHPDVLLLAADTVADALVALRRLDGTAPAPLVLVLLRASRGADADDVLLAGAHGIVPADVTPDVLAGAVHLVAYGGAVLGPVLRRRLLPPPPSRVPAAGTIATHPMSIRLGQLSPRELDVLRLLAAGHSNDEVADALYVSRATVKSHVAHLLTKLGVRSRLQAVVAAYRSGLVDPSAHQMTP